jgi:hypothetical protein
MMYCMQVGRAEHKQLTAHICIVPSIGSIHDKMHMSMLCSAGRRQVQLLVCVASLQAGAPPAHPLPAMLSVVCQLPLQCADSELVAAQQPDTPQLLLLPPLLLVGEPLQTSSARGRAADTVPPSRYCQR